MKNALRILAIIVALVFMTGFGLCGAFGVVFGAAQGRFGIAIILLGLLGLGIACVFCLALTWLLKQGKSSRDES